MSSLSLLEIISVITAFQLLMLGLVLLKKGSRLPHSNRILSLFMFANALVMIHFLASLSGTIILTPIPIFYYLLAPLIYLYVRSMCLKDFHLKLLHLSHGIIFLMALLYVAASMIFIPDYAQQWGYYEYIISSIVLHVQIAVYVVASLITIYGYRREIKNIFSAIEQINLSWLLFIIFAFATMWFTDFIAFIIDLFFKELEGANYYLLVASVSINLLFANYLVYKGLRQADAFSGLKVPEKYSSSKIPEEESSRMVKRLKEIMQTDKPYLNPDLSIKDLSEHFNIHPKFLSQIINSQFEQNFFDFVNFYRIEEAKQIIRNNTDEKMTILEILYEVGFNSKSAFNNAFKKNTGMTPSEFKRTG